MSTFSTVAAIYMSLISVATILGNGLVLIIYFLDKNTRTPSNLYIASLAVVDLLTGTIQLPLLIGYEVSESWPFGPALCFSYIYIGWVLISVSVLHLIAIAVDRFQVIHYGFPYMLRRTVGRVLKTVGFIWIFSIWQMASVVFKWEQVQQILSVTGKCASIPSPVERFHLCFGVYYFPVVVLCSVYYGVYKEIGTQCELREGMTGGRFNFVENRNYGSDSQ